MLGASSSCPIEDEGSTKALLVAVRASVRLDSVWRRYHPHSESPCWMRESMCALGSECARTFMQANAIRPREIARRFKVDKGTYELALTYEYDGKRNPQ